MSKLLSKIAGFLSSRTLVGVDKHGNRYFTKKEEIDGIMKEKRWVIFKAEQEPTSIPVEWISWLNGQRKKAPTPEEMIELDARRERVKLNVALLKEEDERKCKDGTLRRAVTADKAGSPDLKSFIQQVQDASFDDDRGERPEEVSNAMDGTTEKLRNSEPTKGSKSVQHKAAEEPESSEPRGSGESFKPGTWQPPI